MAAPSPIYENPLLYAYAQAAVKARRSENSDRALHGLAQVGRAMAGLEVQPFPAGMSAKEKAEISARLAETLSRLSDQSSSLQISADDIQREAMRTEREMALEESKQLIELMKANGDIAAKQVEAHSKRMELAMERSNQLRSRISLSSEDEGRISEIMAAFESGQPIRTDQGDLGAKAAMTQFISELGQDDPAKVPAAVDALNLRAYSQAQNLARARIQDPQELEKALQALAKSPPDVRRPETLAGTYLSEIHQSDINILNPTLIAGYREHDVLNKEVVRSDREADEAYVAANREGAGYIKPHQKWLNDQAERRLAGENVPLSDTFQSSSSTTGPAGQAPPSSSAPASPSSSTPPLGSAERGGGGALPQGDRQPVTVTAPGTGGQQVTANVPTNADRIAVSGPTPLAEQRIERTAKEIEQQLNDIRNSGPAFKMYKQKMMASPQFQEWMDKNGYTDHEQAARIALDQAIAHQRDQGRETRATEDAHILGGAASDGTGFGQQLKAALSKDNPATIKQKAFALYREQARREMGAARAIAGAGAKGVEKGVDFAKDKVEALKERMGEKRAHREDEAEIEKEKLPGLSISDLPTDPEPKDPADSISFDNSADSVTVEEDTTPPSGEAPASTAEAVSKSPTMSEEDRRRARQGPAPQSTWDAIESDDAKAAFADNPEPPATRAAALLELQRQRRAKEAADADPTP